MAKISFILVALFFVAFVNKMEGRQIVGDGSGKIAVVGNCYNTYGDICDTKAGVDKCRSMCATDFKAYKPHIICQFSKAHPKGECQCYHDIC
ncbi:hypothetical protein ABFX02_01G076000 [Erythranthe guttata]